MTAASDQEASNVIAFLNAHPDFLNEHPELLSSDHANPSTSLTTRQLATLRERNQNLEGELRTYRENARANDIVFQRVRAFSLALAGARSAEHVNDAIASHLLGAFNLSEVVVFTATNTQWPHWRRLDPALFRELKIELDSGSTLWTLRPNEYERLFGCTITAPGSVAIAPFAAVPGALALGSRDAQRFSQQQDTVFLDFTVALIEQTISRLVD